MSDATRMLRHTAEFASRLGGIVERLSAPWLLLGCRLWLGQIVLVRQAMAMMVVADPAGAQGTAGAASWNIESGFWLVAPLGLVMGLLTLPIALALLLRAVLPAGHAAGVTAGVIAELPAAVLLIWLVAAGPGPFSLDGLFGYGLGRSAIGPARRIGEFYAALTRILRPIALV